MGRFRTNRFNPWTNLNKMLDQKNTKTVDEEVITFKSEVNEYKLNYIIFLKIVMQNIVIYEPGR